MDEINPTPWNSTVTKIPKINHDSDSHDVNNKNNLVIKSKKSYNKPDRQP